MRSLDEPTPPGQPGNQAPVIRAPKRSWFKDAWKWLMEETDAEEARKTRKEKKAEKKRARSKPKDKQAPRHVQAHAAGTAYGPIEGEDPSYGTYETEDGSYNYEEGHYDPEGQWVADPYSQEHQEPYAAADAPDPEDEPEDEDPPEKRDVDWRWATKQFFTSKKRMYVGLRTGILLFLVLSVAWLSFTTVTGYDPVDRFFAPVDEEDPSTWYRAPFFIVESGSMMHPDAPFGRLGTIDPGDVVVIQKVDSPEEVQTFYGPGDEKTGGARGDVIVYIPASTRENPFPQPIVHRAMAYLQRDIIQIPNPNPTPGGSPTISVPRFTVEEFGIYDARAVTIPELGLYNYRPDRSGFLTRGDNPRTNDLADQGLGVTPHPVEHDRILGRVAHTVPYAGLTRIALMGQDPALLSPDHEWCTFLAGQAPCDNWVVFLVLLYVFVGVPFMITVIVFTRRATVRWRERRRFQQEQEAALQQYQAERKADGEIDPDDRDPSALQAHDALDLLSGRVVPVGQLRRAPRRDDRNRIRPGIGFHGGGT